MKQQVPQAQCFSATTQTHLCLWHCPSGLGRQGKLINMLIYMLLTLQWIMKSFVSDPGVSCLLPVPMKQYYTKLLEFEKGKSQVLELILFFYNSEQACSMWNSHFLKWSSLLHSLQHYHAQWTPSLLYLIILVLLEKYAAMGTGLHDSGSHSFFCCCCCCYSWEVLFIQKMLS